MAQVSWPTRIIQCSTLNLGISDFFSMDEDNSRVITIGAPVTYIENGVTQGTMYIQQQDKESNPGNGYSISSDPDGKNIERLAGRFALEMDVGIVTNYPTRPMLVDPGVQTHTSVSNPLDRRTWTQGFPVYEGSVTLDVGFHEDVPLVEAFIDQLHDPDAWFELPLPGNHLSFQNIREYDSSNGDIKIDLRSGSGNPALQDRYVHGWFARVGSRTAKIISSSIVGDDLVIRITPPGLINGDTSQSQSNSFSGVKTCRVRAVNISSTGSPDYGATWSIDWIETNRKD